MNPALSTAAPDAALQPAAVPHGRRPGGGPWATPLARARACERRIDLSTWAAPDRPFLRARDIPERAGSAPYAPDCPISPVRVPHLLVVDVDVTVLCRRLDEAADAFSLRERARPTVLLLVTQAVVRALRSVPGVLPPGCPDASVDVVVRRPDGWSEVQDAGLLSVGGLARALDATPSRAEPGGAGFALVDTGSDDIDLEIHPLIGGRRAVLSVGAVRREARVLTGPDGDAVGIRRGLRLGLALDAALVDRADGIAFLKQVRAIVGDMAAGLELAR